MRGRSLPHCCHYGRAMAGAARNHADRLVSMSQWQPPLTREGQQKDHRGGAHERREHLCISG
eukprot:scaffold19706_cov29-Tisochrysis_lutea.AAC.5